MAAPLPQGAFHSCPFEYDELFGQEGPSIMIFGTKAAIDELNKGISGEGLRVQVYQPDNASAALEQSLESLRQRNAFPSNEMLLRFAAQPPEL